MFNDKEIEGIKKNVRELSGFIDRVYLKNSDEQFFLFKSDFNLFYAQIEGLYRHWFPKAKEVSDIDIINHLFNDIFEKDAKQFVKYGMQCLLRSAARIFVAAENDKAKSDNHRLMADMRLLHEIAFEAPIFLNVAFRIMEKSNVDFGHGKRFQLQPREVLFASQFILRQYVPENLVGDFAIPPTSAFLIRQAIELWLQDIFAISSVFDEKTKKFVKLQPERLFALLNDEFVKLPLPKGSIQKIHSWTQRYVHTGSMEYVWEVEHAQFILRPLFYSNNVKITKTYFDDIEKHLRQIFGNENLKVNRKPQYSSTLE